MVVPFAVAADNEDEVGESVETFTLEMQENSPFKDVLLQQNRLLKKILEIQEKTLLILKKSKNSGSKKQAEKLLKKVHTVKKETVKQDEEIKKAASRPKKSKKGLTFEYTYTEEDVLAP